jgi:hypothetical protein
MSPTVHREVVDAAICRDCQWYGDGTESYRNAESHANRTGHRVSAEHRERTLFDWERTATVGSD